MSLPNFLIVGASKAGTSSLWRYLNEHPDIFLPEPKEPLFFIKDIYNNLNKLDPGINAIKSSIIQNEEDYRKLFNTDRDIKNKGEATASYLYYHENVIPKMLNLLSSKTKIIIILREPVDKVISHYKFYRGKGWEKKSFSKALENESWRISNNYNPFFHYTKQGFYYASVKNYLDHFENVHICFYEDMKHDSQYFLNRIFDFLDVDRLNIEIASQIFNKSYLPKSNSLHTLLRISASSSNALRQKMSFIQWKKLKNTILRINEESSLRISENQKSYLKNLFRKDVEKLECLLKVNLKDKWNY